MNTFNTDRFVKVLALAESDNDAEALAAVRRAAQMARASGMSLGEAVGEAVQKTEQAAGEGGAMKFALDLAKAEMEKRKAAEERIRSLEQQFQRAADRLKELGADSGDPAFLTNAQLYNRLRNLRTSRGASMIGIYDPQWWSTKDRAYVESVYRRELAGGPSPTPANKASKRKVNRQALPGGAA